MTSSAHSVTSGSTRQQSSREPSFRLGLYLGRHSGGGGGIAVYTRDLLLHYLEFLEAGEFPHLELFIYTSQATLDQCSTPALRKLLSGASPRFRLQLLPEGGGRKVGTVLDILTLGLRARKDRIDLLHCTANYGCFLPGCPQVITIHDLFQGWPPGTRFPPLTSLLYRLLFRLQLPAAAHLLVDAPSTAEEIARRFRTGKKNITAIPLGLESELCRFLRNNELDESTIEQRISEMGIAAGYVVHFAASDPRKNTERAVKAWLSLPEELRDRKLVLKINDEAAGDAIKRIVPEDERKLNVRIVPWLTREQLFYLYLGADASLIPSLAEGFGFPALESCALGTPVVSSELDCLRALKTDLVEECDPLDEGSISAALERALRQSRSNATIQGFHTMEQAARDTLNLSLELLLHSS